MSKGLIQSTPALQGYTGMELDSNVLNATLQLRT